jgi:hypothetical protein
MTQQLLGREPAVPTPVERYASQLGWTVEQVGGEWRLCFGNGLVGVYVPTGIAGEVLARLRAQEVLGPVLELAGPPTGSVFLAEQNGLVLSRRDLPVGVQVLGCPHQVPLPPPGAYAGKGRWLVTPDLARRVLPLVATVVAATR